MLFEVSAIVLLQQAGGLQGTRNLVAAAMQGKVKKFVLVTSIGTDDPLFPLNLLFGVSCSDVLLSFAFSLWCPVFPACSKTTVTG